MDKPQKPTNLLPRSFGGQKEAFDADKIANGYQPDVPDILGGANLNYTLDAMGKELEYTEKITDFVNGLPINNIITTDENNKLVYKDLKKIDSGDNDVQNMYTTGTVSEDERGYNQLAEMKRSTFDESKFIVVGSPVVTDDGVASGFSASSYLNIPVQDLSKNDFEISYKFTYTPTSIIQNIFRCATNTYGGTFGFLVGIDTQGKIYLSGAASEGSVSTPLIAGNTYTSKITIKGSVAKLYVNEVEAISYTWNKSISAAYISIGNGSNTFAGSIDLSQFSITADGQEVFSGNKTGLDVIKPDDYTVVGSPVITDDGIASGFSASNYINTDALNYTLGNKWECNTTFTSPIPLVGGNKRIFMNRVNNTFMCCLEDSNLRVWFGNGSNWVKEGIIITSSIQTGTKYNLKIKVVNNTASCYVNGELKSTITDIPNITLSYFNIGGDFGMSARFFTGSIDLNSFKIYVDGDLVYQPCLKIPYTDSKTGSKIVNAVYRDRVQDIYEQYGTAMYYTLDEENKNFTLPMGEIYGMIGQKNPNGTTPPLFTPVIMDHVLSFENSLGYALQGTYVYKEGVAGSRYGYPDFYQRCVDEKNAAQDKFIEYETIGQPIFTSNTTDGITISDSLNRTTVLQNLMNGTTDMVSTYSWSTYWVNINYNTPTVLKSYTIQADNLGETEYPSAWSVQGSNDGINYDIISSESGQTFTKNQSKTYQVTQNTPYKQYKIVFSAGIESGGSGELKKITFTANKTFTAKQNTNGHVFYDIADKAAVDTLYNNTGIADMYGVDTENERIFMPRRKLYKNTHNGVIPVIGNGKTLGLTDGTHTSGLQSMPYAQGVTDQSTLRAIGDAGAVNGTSSSGGNILAVGMVGVSTNSDKSGIQGVLEEDTGRYIYYVVGNISEITHVTTTIPKGEVTQQINKNTSDITDLKDDKVNKDGSNATIITETYKQGTSWYRVWSDGWCEQGGFIPNGGTSVTLLKAYSNADYGVLTETNNKSAGDNVLGVQNKTLTSFTVASSNHIRFWKACGYIN